MFRIVDVRTVTKHLMCVLFLPLLACAGEWKLAGPFGGSATTLAMDPSNSRVLVAGTRNGHIFRSDNAGESWERLPFPSSLGGSVQALLIDPANQKHYLAGVRASNPVGSGLFESQDGGMTWKKIPEMNGNSVEALAVYSKDPKIMAAASRKGVFESKDGGNSWNRISPERSEELLAVTAVAYDPRNPEHLYAGTTHLPWKTTDGGKTWNSIHVGMLDDSDVFSIYVNLNQPDQVFASACSGIYRTTSAGQQWQKFMGIPGTQRRTHVVRQDPQKPEILYAGTTVGLLKSVDSGATWKLMNNLQLNWLVIDPADPRIIYFAAENSGIWKSTDRGDTVKPLNSGFVNRMMNRAALSGRRVYVNAIQDGVSGGVFYSEDGGVTWRRDGNSSVLDGPVLTSLSSAPEGDTPLFAATEDRLLKSTDGGKTWGTLPVLARTRKGAPLASVRGKVLTLQTLRNGKPVLLMGHSTGLLRSLDLGATWQKIPLEPAPSAVTAIFAPASHSQHAVARTANALYFTKDSGLSWTRWEAPSDPSWINDLALTSNPDGPVLAATAAGLFRAAAPGASWVLCHNGLPRETVSAVRFQPGRETQAYAVAYGRLYRTSDAGSSWEAMTSSSAAAPDIRSLLFSPQPQRVLGVTADLGVVFFDLVETR
ncbi:MAG: hypothetical protein IT161_08790 [Bryobacterales bacterium]|nr:hypothetical protein [Bryobacterales bacterium]